MSAIDLRLSSAGNRNNNNNNQQQIQNQQQQQQTNDRNPLRNENDHENVYHETNENNYLNFNDHNKQNQRANQKHQVHGQHQARQSGHFEASALLKEQQHHYQSLNGVNLHTNSNFISGNKYVGGENHLQAIMLARFRQQQQLVAKHQLELLHNNPELCNNQPMSLMQHHLTLVDNSNQNSHHHPFHHQHPLDKHLLNHHHLHHLPYHHHRHHVANVTPEMMRAVANNNTKAAYGDRSSDQMDDDASSCSNSNVDDALMTLDEHDDDDDSVEGLHQSRSSGAINSSAHSQRDGVDEPAPNEPLNLKKSFMKRYRKFCFRCFL